MTVRKYELTEEQVQNKSTAIVMIVMLNLINMQMEDKQANKERCKEKQKDDLDRIRDMVIAIIIQG